MLSGPLGLRRNKSEFLETIVGSVVGNIECAYHCFQSGIYATTCSCSFLGYFDDHAAGHQDSGGETVCLPFHPLGIRLLPRSTPESMSIIRTALNHRHDVFRRGVLRCQPSEVGRVQNPVRSLVACSKSVAVLLVLGQQVVIDDYGSCSGGDILSAAFGRVENCNPIRVVEHGHAQIEAAVGKVLEVLCHTKVPGDEPINVNLGRYLNRIRVEVLDETFANAINLSTAENG